jgi:hypothetical protein
MNAKDIIIIIKPIPIYLSYLASIDPHTAAVKGSA